ncbi:MAG: UDP-N-acetylmuramate--L-alanine ligase [Patescibacteria group bacterium]|nr:UDP-N-acetylmuramate--L-alanine ligase [Patescibacteria group bacterium]
MIQIDLSKIKKVYFVGIGGIGISAVAKMMLQNGTQVGGSDMSKSGITDELEKSGAKIDIGQDFNFIPKETELIIYTTAIEQYDHELMDKIRVSGIPSLSYPESLNVISKNKYTIAVSGTHGKTTTTAMIAKILIDAGKDPTVIVGSLMSDSHSNFIAGKSNIFVVEACEYKRAFLNLNPNILVITNIDADHLDYYKDLDDIKSAFAELKAKLPKDGFLIDDFIDIQLPVDFKLKIPGRHNIANAKAALSVARALNIPDEKSLKSLSEFSGTWRRFEYRGKTKSKTVVYDDYGHHPHEIEATLQGVRELYPSQKIVVIFQPHLYSRTVDHFIEFGKCFKQANDVILLPIFPAREKDPGNINSEMVVEEIKKNGQSAYYGKTFEDVIKKTLELVGKNDVIITMGAGETNKVADALVK